jgi:hypothetical protein
VAHSSVEKVGTATRYPGAQPFGDDELSRKLFFGREQAASDVTNQILANRLLVIYAQSGLGKTSLLHAGVSPRLRQEGHLPLRARVNDAERGALRCVFEGVLDEARRQGVECVTGTTSTLWSFFKTLELWRGDMLLTPVLVLDQFEELFTLQGDESRREFLDQLGFLVRGVCPPGDESLHASAKPPALRIVLSLREDYLGLLEEAADQIPEILDQRYRLAPLSLEAAREALVGPARLEEPGFESLTFEYAPETLQLISSYLSRRRLSNAAQVAGDVEPFHLQLICQRVERLVVERKGPAGYVVTVADLGGAAGLDAALEGFYQGTLRALPRRSERRLAERLCREYLISEDGRRLSVDEGELEEQSGASPELLQRLVRSRLLRTELRADSSYYEISHDALVEPVLAARRTGALTLSWIQFSVGSLGLLLAFVTFLGALATKPWQKDSGTVVSSGIFIVLALLVGWLFVSVLRSGWRRLRRYHKREELEPVQPDL